jgi:acetyl-CoA C-acetyltransferase
MSKEVFIVGVSRTPIGSFGGSLSSLPAPKLASFCIKDAISKAGIKATAIEEVFYGNVLNANMGQAPARQAALFSGVSNTTPCTTVNKVCASGSKAIMLGAQAIRLGERDVVLAGGMESMSNVPYYLDKARSGYRLGHGQVTDGIVKDGLWDVYNDYHMGNAGEACASEMDFSREEQDAYAIESYKRSEDAWNNGHFKNEVTPVEIKTRKGSVTVDEDEEFRNINIEKVPNLRPVFQKDGTITAANASTINDGAAAVVLMSKEKAEELGVKPLARILSYADAAQEPEKFTTAPAKAIPLALKKANLTVKEVDFFEINEAFSVVSLANNKLLDLDPKKVNIYGGAVSLGHPIGCSGARILVTLTSVLQNNDARIGVIGICNGGGGASAIVIEKL